MVYLANAFSLQMIEPPMTIVVEEVLSEHIPSGVYSVVGHRVILS